MAYIEKCLENKTILLTGGTGSFGHKFVDAVLPMNPRAIRIFSRDELKQSQMEAEYHDGRLRFLIGDVRNVVRLKRAMAGVDIAIHAAALKRIEKCEYDPQEAVETNIDGTKNIINAALDCGVDKVIGLSTDKGVYPATLYGMTKAVAERLLVQANVFGGRFAVVRYGNVLGSRGSVIPLFRQQSQQGIPLTITHPDMTRFWLTLDQAVRLVFDCLMDMNGGEIFVPKLPSMRIMDLARVVAPNSAMAIVGMRPAEKLHEVLITEEESRHTQEFDNYYVIEPEFPFWRDKIKLMGKKLPEGFQYTSGNNGKILSISELEGLIAHG